MPRLLFGGKYIIFSLIFTAGVIFSIFKINSPLFGSLTLFFYYLFFGFYLGQFFLPQEKRFWKIFFGIFGLVAIQTIILTVVYWFYEFNAQILTLTMIFSPILIALQKIPREEIFSDIEKMLDFESYRQAKSYLGTKFLSFIFLIFEVAIFSTLLSRQYTDTLISPWTIFGPRFFLAFIFSSFLLLWILQKSKDNSWNLFLILVHTGIILSVATIVFKLGFGFDPFIHQAAEKWIAEHGTILPKQPYYLGQYLFVLTQNFVTHLSVNFLDKILVPLTAIFILPLASYFVFSRSGYTEKLHPALILIALWPLNFFTQTTPNNFALILSFLLFLWIWYEIKNHTTQTRLWGLLLSFFICVIHPFIGLPVLTIYIGSTCFSFIQKQKPKYTYYLFTVLYSSLLTIILPLTFYLNSLRLGEKIVWQNPFSNWQNFLSIFTAPHWLWFERGTALLQTLYFYRQIIKPLVAIAIMTGIFIAWRKYQEKTVNFFLFSALALLISSILLSTTITFSEVISYEQNVYSQRILELMLILLLPFFIIALRELFLFLRKKSAKQFLIALLFSLLLFISWYFSYPTRDKISLYTGYNVRQADIQAVHFIDNRNDKIKDYIVLTNQTVSAAALREFSFDKYLPTAEGEQYFYSIPTGGPLYQYFRKMVYEEPKRKWMEEAMRFAGVKKAYFVHTNYWAPAAEIRDQAKLEADEWWELDDGRVWIYEYTLK